MTSVAETLRAAEAAAAALPAVVQGAGTAVAEAYPTGAVPSMDSFMSSGNTADYYIQPEKNGYLQIDHKGALEEIDASIIVSEIRAVSMIRYGNPAKYYKTYNGTHATTGESWGAILKMAHASDPKFRGDFPSVELIFVNQKEINFPKLDLIVPKGATLGYTPTATTKRLAQSFIADVKSKGLDAVHVKLTAEKMKNASFTWGGLRITAVGPWNLDE